MMDFPFENFELTSEDIKIRKLKTSWSEKRWKLKEKGERIVEIKVKGWKKENRRFKVILKSNKVETCGKLWENCDEIWRTS